MSGSVRSLAETRLSVVSDTGTLDGTFTGLLASWVAWYSGLITREKEFQQFWAM
jgi:hypothetical protein